MENMGDLDKRPLINELTQGRELAKQLRIYLDPTSMTGGLLIEKILSSFDKALSLMNRTGLDGEPQPMTPTVGMSDSPRSISGSPQSDDTDHRDVFKKRKSLPRWTEQVQVCSRTGLEGPLDDGYSWRKYGQKDILGAKHPRGYYRCTYRNVQGCLATKQVQRSDDNPSIIDVTYRGRHTCIQVSHLIQASQSSDKEDQKQNQDQPEQKKQKQSQEILLNFRTGLKVKTENSGSQELASSFSFPPTSMESVKTDDQIFSSTPFDNNFMGSFSPTFISPTTSESNYFSPCRITSFSGGPNFQNSESDLNEIISAATSASNSPIVDLDFTLDPVEFDPNFPFDMPGFFN